MLQEFGVSVIAGEKRMSEFDEFIARMRARLVQSREMAARLEKTIDLLEKAKETLRPEDIDRILHGASDHGPVEPARARSIYSPDQIAAGARDVLREFNRPMKRREIAKELEKRGLLLVGNDRNKNLGTILWRHKKIFVSLENLGYWLRDVPLEGVYTPTN